MGQTNSLWGRIKQAYGTDIHNSGEGLGLYVAVKESRNLKTKQLRATPLVIVPGVPGKTIMPLQFTASVPVVGIARTGAYATHLRWRDGTTFLNASGEIDRTTMHGATANARFAHVNMTGTGHAQSLEDVDLVIHNTGAAEYGAGSGNNIITFRVFYTLI